MAARSTRDSTPERSLGSDRGTDNNATATVPAAPHQPRSQNQVVPASRLVTRIAPLVAFGLGLRILAAGPAPPTTVLLFQPSAQNPNNSSQPQLAAVPAPRPRNGADVAAWRGMQLTAHTRPATDRKQRGAALGTVALPTGATVGQSYLACVGNRDLCSADASTLRSRIGRGWRRVGHVEQHIRLGLKDHLHIACDRGGSSQLSVPARTRREHHSRGDQAVPRPRRSRRAPARRPELVVEHLLAVWLR